MRTAIGRSLPFVGGLALAVGLTLLLAFSCSSTPNFDFTGNWVGNRHLPAAGGDTYAAYTAGWVTLKIKDEKFDLMNAGIPTSGTISGGGDHIVLNAQTVMGLSLSREAGDPAKNHPPINVRPGPNGSVIFEDPKAIDGKPLSLTREKQ